MTRNLKVLLAAAMAVAACGAFSASGAQAAEFHCDPASGQTSCNATLKPDGTTMTAHHVYEVENRIGETISFTCTQLDGSGTAFQTAATVTIATNLQYTTCKANGQNVVVRFNKCAYVFSAAGTVTIANCESGKKIEVEVASGCIVTIGAQGPLAGIKYHNLGTTAANTTEVTVEAKVFGVEVWGVDNPLGCFNTISPPYFSEYKTGNTIGTAESDPGNVMVPGWWA